MAKFLSTDAQQQVFTGRIFAIESLNLILHGCRQFAIGPAELLEQHVAKYRIGITDIDCIHQFFYVVVHISDAPSFLELLVGCEDLRPNTCENRGTLPGLLR